MFVLKIIFAVMVTIPFGFLGYVLFDYIRSDQGEDNQ